MKNIIILIALITFVISSKAQGFEPFVIIDPPNPMVGDIIQMGVAHTLHPGCLDLPGTNVDGLTHLYEFDNNDIELFVVNGPLIPICFPFPIIPAFREWYELGVLVEGNYTLKTLVIGESVSLPILPGANVFPSQYGPMIAFAVSAPPLVIPSNNLVGLIILFFSLIAFSIVHFFFSPNNSKQP